MKFESMVVGNFVENKSSGEVMLIVNKDEDGDIQLSGSEECNLVEKDNAYQAKHYRKKIVSAEFSNQFSVKDKTKGKIVYLHNVSDGNHIGMGYRLVGANDLSGVPLYLEGEEKTFWEYALNVAHPTHTLAVEYNKRVDNGVVNKEEAMEIIKLLNASGIKESIAEM